MLDNTTYVLAGMSGSPLFDPASIGLAPASVMSACWRGYVCTYGITAHRLHLNALQIMLGHFTGERRQRTFVPHQGPPLQGIESTFTTEPSAFFIVIGNWFVHFFNFALPDAAREPLVSMDISVSDHYNNTYADLNLDMPFTGGLLLADGFIDELYVHMGFHPAWKYTTVIEIRCDAGTVVDKRDISQRVAAMRIERLSRAVKPGKVDREALQTWIESTFRRDYDR